jgi:hypothetical protein
MMNSLVAGAFFHSDEVGMLGDLLDHRWWDILSRATWNIVDNRRTKIETTSEMLEEASSRSFTVVGVDLQRCVHSHGESLFGRMNCFGRIIAASITDDFDLIAEFVSAMSNQHDVLVPAHQVALSRSSTDDQTFNSVLDLRFDKDIESLEIELPVRKIRSLDGSNQRGFAQIHARVLSSGRRSTVSSQRSVVSGQFQTLFFGMTLQLRTCSEEAPVYSISIVRFLSRGPRFYNYFRGNCSIIGQRYGFYLFLRFTHTRQKQTRKAHPRGMNLGHKVCSKQNGLFAKIPIRAGEIILRITNDPSFAQTGAEISSEEAEEPPDYFMLYEDPSVKSVGVETGEKIRISHSCNPNCWFKNKSFELVSRREIAEDEEITFDFATSETETSRLIGRECVCGRSQCRGPLTGLEYRNIRFVQAYRAHLSK